MIISLLLSTLRTVFIYMNYESHQVRAVNCDAANSQTVWQLTEPDHLCDQSLIHTNMLLHH